MCREKAGSNVSLCAPADGLTAPSLSLSFFACAKCHISLLRHKNHDKGFGIENPPASQICGLIFTVALNSTTHHCDGLRSINSVAPTETFQLKKFVRMHQEQGQMAQGLKVYTVLTDILGLVPGTYIR